MITLPKKSVACFSLMTMPCLGVSLARWLLVVLLAGVGVAVSATAACLDGVPSGVLLLLVVLAVRFSPLVLDSAVAY